MRLTGVKAENLRPAATTPEQLSLDDLAVEVAGDPGAARADAADARASESVLDAARARFGPNALSYATLLGSTDPGPGGGRR